MGPVALEGAKRQVGTGIEVTCSQGEVIGPVVEVDSVPVAVSSAIELTGMEAWDVVSLVVQVVPVDVLAFINEVMGSSYKLACSSLQVEMLRSVDEVRGSVVEIVFFAVLDVASVIHVGPDVLSEVNVVESMGPVVKVGASVQVMDPLVEAGGDPVLLESISASCWLSSTGLMGYAFSGLATGIVGDVGSGLVPGLKGHGVSSRLPVSE